MLHSPPRPRAPSIATLHVLYQLAYISSGTALGVGALCAEERRRRTQVVQRIADNARRLRQSPRYAHAAAARVERAEREGGWWRDAEGVVKGEELPSVVERGYGRLAGGRRTRTRTGRPEFVEAHGGVKGKERDVVSGRRKTAVKPPEQGSGKKAMLRLSRVWTVPHRVDQRPLGERRKDATSMTADYLHYRRPPQSPGQAGNDAPPLERISRAKELYHATPIGRMAPSPPERLDYVAYKFSTRDAWSEFSFQKSSVLDVPYLLPKLESDLDLFFAQVDRDAVVHLSCEQACWIAARLLHLALACGCLHAVESLLLWKRAVKDLTDADFCATIEAFPILAHDDPPDQVLQLYDDLFATVSFRSLSAARRAELALTLTSAVLKFQQSADDHCAENTCFVWDNWRWLKSSELAHNAKVTAISRHCKQLILEGHLSESVQLYCLAESKYPLRAEQLADDLFDAAIDAKHTSLCRHLLRVKIHAGFRTRLASQVDEYIQLCADSGVHAAIRGFYGSGLVTRAKMDLSDRTHAHLCRAYALVADTAQGREMFDRLWRRQPVHARKQIIDSHLAVRSASLKFERKISGNQKALWRAYDSALEWAERHKSSREAVRSLKFSMAENLLSSRVPKHAMRVLKHIEGPQAGGKVGAIAALCFAKEGDWTSFVKLVEILKRDYVVCDWSPPATRAFNNSLHLFSKDHSLQETTALAIDAVHKLKFVPNQATFDIMLSCAVSRRDLTMLKHWLRLPKTLGLQMRVNSNIVASLIKRWYLDARHAHEYIMWYCRRLTQYAPNVSGDKLLNTIKEAIGYDFRHLHGQNAPLMEHFTRQRAGMIADGHGRLPKPGNIRGKQLYNIDTQTSPAMDLSYNNPRSLQLPQETDNSGFALLRDEYQRHQRPNFVANSDDYDVFDPDNRERLERGMLLDMSFARYDSVLSAYTSSLDATSHPLSPLTLEIALEASIRQSGSTTHAEALLASARNAGMNVSPALGPLLIHRLRTLERLELSGAQSLRLLALDYYRMNASHGTPVRHHVGTHAAHTLIAHGFPDHGVNLLDAIFKSEWSTQTPLDAPAMAVWMQGYSALKNWDGVAWVVSTVLERNVRVDRGFLMTLRRLQRPRHVTENGSVVYLRQPRHVRVQLHTWLEDCRARREEQRRESRVFGREMVQALISAVNNGGVLPEAGSAEELEEKRARRRSRGGLVRKHAARWGRGGSGVGRVLGATAGALTDGAVDGAFFEGIEGVEEAVDGAVDGCTDNAADAIRGSREEDVGGAAAGMFGDAAVSMDHQG